MASTSGPKDVGRGVPYERIPETDSLSIDHRSNSASENYGYRKLIAGFFFLFILIGVLFSFIMTYYHDTPPRNDAVFIYQTSKDHNDKLKLMSMMDFHERGYDLVESSFREDSSELNQVNYGDMSSADLSFNPEVRYQSIIGFGGAFTEASAYNFFKLPVPQRDKFLEAYFGENGIGYSVGRIHINSCDFSLSSYSFDDIEGDYELEHFDSEVVHDTHQIIPFILAAMKKSKRAIQLLASPWSPPAWMKVPAVLENNKTVSKMTGSHTPNGLRSDHRVMTAWARYISLFISAYENHGVPLWAITPQNEPEFAAPWEACSYNASFESHFVENYLGPIIRAEHPEIKILAFDHNKDHLLSWAQTMLFPEKSKRSEYVDGMAFHWYSGMDRLLDGTYGYESVNATYHLAPDKILMATEGCSCPGVEINSWLRAERLGHDVLYDLNNYAQGWIDWNLLVDSKGGPNHLNNFCDSPIVAREDFTHFHIQPKYYYMGHFSKFIPPRSQRIHVNIIGNYHYKKIHPVLHSGLEAGVYPCESSVKQMWFWDSAPNPAKNISGGRLRLMMSGTMENEAKAPPNEKIDEQNLIEFCLSKGDSQRDYLTIWECPPITAKSDDPRLQRALTFSMIPFQSEKSNVRYVQLRYDLTINNDSSIPYCVTLTQSGLLRLKSCSTQDINQQWIYHLNTGEIRSYHSSHKNYCLTAGWPYLSSTGYLTPTNEIVLVVMNEAPLDTYVTLRDLSTHSAMRVAIHSHSIETILFNRNKKN